MGNAGLVGSLGNMFKDPNFLNFLVNTGAGLIDSPSAQAGANVLNQMQQRKALQQLFASMGSGSQPSTEMQTTPLASSVPINPFTGSSMPNLANGPQQPQQPQQSNFLTPTYNPGTISPFSLASLSNIPASDLAGLNPELMMQALQLKLGENKLISDSFENQFNRGYKQKVMESIDAQIAEGKSQLEINKTEGFRKLFDTLRGDALDQPFIIPYGGKGISVRQWNALPKDEQDYAIYANNEGDKALSREEFKLMDPTDREKFLTKAMNNPKLMKAAKELASAGASNINLSPAERTMQTGLAEDKLTILDPDFASKTRAEVIKSAGPLGDPNTIIADTIRAMDDKMVRVYGEDNVKVSKDGWTIVDKDRGTTHFIPRPIQ